MLRSKLYTNLIIPSVKQTSYLLWNSNGRDECAMEVKSRVRCKQMDSTHQMVSAELGKEATQAQASAKKHQVYSVNTVSPIPKSILHDRTLGPNLIRMMMYQCKLNVEGVGICLKGNQLRTPGKRMAMSRFDGGFGTRFSRERSQNQRRTYNVSSV